MLEHVQNPTKWAIPTKKSFNVFFFKCIWFHALGKAVTA